MLEHHRRDPFCREGSDRRVVQGREEIVLGLDVLNNPPASRRTNEL
jgi:hypothetical protein